MDMNIIKSIDYHGFQLVTCYLGSDMNEQVTHVMKDGDYIRCYVDMVEAISNRDDWIDA